MKIISIPLTDSTYARALKQASSTGLDVTALCTSILIEYFDTETGTATPRKQKLSSKHSAATAPQNASDFNVRENFPNFPEQSIHFAEIFLKEVQRVDPTVELRKHANCEVDIRDNFVRIEALLKRKHGIRVSFYGTPDKFKNAPAVLRQGMGSYSRAVIENMEDLREILPMIQQARNLKTLR
ncbi:hypothetical protein [Persicirhabdus sediminis]|uniref:Uncharacterized protein n=1 Tax=Persicirhabdus sediminis TaxID=454144 RepID=A0A8J7MJU2_9BACT|nr:hypothetical protein [Persicirhabdus sediminis]MBK1792328.1 hypothetical protein [Persicirhabdus sediminis]